jgi:hypothetical protein
MLEDTLKLMGAEIPNYDPNAGIFTARSPKTPLIQR